MKTLLCCCLLIFSISGIAQTPVDFSDFDKNGPATATVANNLLEVTWPISEVETGKLMINLERENALLESIQVGKEGEFTEIARSLDPVFILTEGQRDLTKGSGWNIFFDRTAYLPHTPHLVEIQKQEAKVTTEGSRTKILIREAHAAHFSGTLELTLYAGSPLLNLAAVMETKKDAVAIIYDAGLVSRDGDWEEVFWSDTKDYLQVERVDKNSEAKPMAVKYRTVVGESKGGSLAVFPPPHQYFYPLDNAYNLKHVWFGTGYRDLIPGFWKRQLYLFHEPQRKIMDKGGSLGRSSQWCFYPICMA